MQLFILESEVIAMTKTEAINYCKGKNRWTAEKMMSFADRLIDENPNLRYGTDIFYLELMPRKMAIEKFFTNKFGMLLVDKVPDFNWLFAYRCLNQEKNCVEQKYILVNNLKELEYKLIELLAE